MLPNMPGALLCSAQLALRAAALASVELRFWFIRLLNLVVEEDCGEGLDGRMDDKNGKGRLEARTRRRWDSSGLSSVTPTVLYLLPTTPLRGWLFADMLACIEVLCLSCQEGRGEARRGEEKTNSKRDEVMIQCSGTLFMHARGSPFFPSSPQYYYCYPTSAINPTPQFN